MDMILQGLIDQRIRGVAAVVDNLVVNRAQSVGQTFSVRHTRPAGRPTTVKILSRGDAA